MIKSTYHVKYQPRSHFLFLAYFYVRKRDIGISYKNDAVSKMQRIVKGNSTYVSYFTFCLCRYVMEKVSNVKIFKIIKYQKKNIITSWNLICLWYMAVYFRTKTFKYFLVTCFQFLIGLKSARHISTQTWGRERRNQQG